VARKKKRKNKTEKRAAASVDAAPAAAVDAVTPATPTSPTAEADSAPSTPPVTPAASEPAVSPSTPASVEPAPSPAPRPPATTAEDLDADLDDDSYDDLVALVAGLPDDEPTSPPAAGRGRSAKSDRDDDVVVVVDLDEEGGTEAVERLIAKAVVGAPPEEVDEEPELPVIDLDADEPPSPPPRGARAGVAPIAPTAADVAARLAAAAARGAIDEDDRPAIKLDLGEVSTPEARARLLAEALAHAEHKEARYRVPMDTGAALRWKGLVTAAVLVLAAWVAVAPPSWVRPQPPAQINAAARARGIRTALLLQAQQVEAYRVMTQRLPASLDELPAKLSNIGYARSGNRAYQLIGYEPDGNAIVYDSADPAPPFRVLMAAWPPAEVAP
jgi:hypothetical protein